MSHSISVEECAGYRIVLMVESGKFLASSGDQSSGMTSYDLNDLRDRLRALAEKERQAKRQKQSPVRVWVYCKRAGQDAVAGSLECVDVVGVVAGRKYNTVLRTLQGQCEVLLVRGDMVVFHHDDVRVQHFASLLATAQDLSKEMVRNSEAITAFAIASPHIECPVAETKEQAFDVEPLFLQALRDIRCYELAG